MRRLPLCFLLPSTVMKSKSCVHINSKQCLSSNTDPNDLVTPHSAAPLSTANTVTPRPKRPAHEPLGTQPCPNLSGCGAGRFGISKLEYNMVQQLQQWFGSFSGNWKWILKWADHAPSVHILISFHSTGGSSRFIPVGKWWGQICGEISVSRVPSSTKGKVIRKWSSLCST